jgi:hypothetical protein
MNLSARVGRLEASSPARPPMVIVAADEEEANRLFEGLLLSGGPGVYTVDMTIGDQRTVETMNLQPHEERLEAMSAGEEGN